MSIGQYICPDPTPEQKALGAILGYDPYDRCGDGVTDTSACDYLCAACLIHDEMFLRGGNLNKWKELNFNFERDVKILVHSIDDSVLKQVVYTEAIFFTEVVWTISWEFFRSVDANTDITRAQSDKQLFDAKTWINQCAFKLALDTPYQEVV